MTTRLPILLTVVIVIGCAPATGLGHGCPYEWNVSLPYGLKFRGTPLTNAIDAINLAVRKTTKNKIPRAVILDPNSHTIAKVTSDSTIASGMDLLIQRYHKEMAPLFAKGFMGHESFRVTDDYPPNMPLACQVESIAVSAGMGYKETKDGLVLIPWWKALECRAYKFKAGYLEPAEGAPRAGQPGSYFSSIRDFFARESGMTRFVMVPDGPQTVGHGSAGSQSVLDAVTLYMPDKKLMLIIETPEGHKKVEENLKKKGLWLE